MDILQFITSIGSESYIDDLDIQMHITPKHIPSSFSSSTLEFPVEFILYDSASMALPNGNFVNFNSQGLATSDTLLMDPDLSSSWIEASIELKRIGLHQDLLIEYVIDALKSRVEYYIRHIHDPKLSVLFSVDIKRVTVVPHNWCHHYLQLLALSLQEDYDDNNVAPDPDHDEDMAIAALTRVNVEEDGKKLNGMSCAICLNDLLGADNLSQVDEELGSMELPCHHIFHGGCIRGWFKRSSLCPLCRSNVLGAH